MEKEQVVLHFRATESSLMETDHFNVNRQVGNSKANFDTIALKQKRGCLEC